MHILAKKGLELFIQQEFYEAHEYFERAWRETRDDSREFYRVLIHLCGGFFRLTQGRVDAAMKFFNRAQYWLSDFSPTYRSIDVASLQEQVQGLLNHHHGKKGVDILKATFPPIREILQERSE
jgi:predicted metal-dependent hydrolase